MSTEDFLKIKPQVPSSYPHFLVDSVGGQTDIIKFLLHMCAFIYTQNIIKSMDNINSQSFIDLPAFQKAPQPSKHTDTFVYACLTCFSVKADQRTDYSIRYIRMLCGKIVCPGDYNFSHFHCCDWIF